MKLSNIWKAWLSSLIGAVIVALGQSGSFIVEGKLDMHVLVATLVPAIALSLTDILKELQKEIQDTNTNK